MRLAVDHQCHDAFESCPARVLALEFIQNFIHIGIEVLALSRIPCSINSRSTSESINLKSGIISKAVTSAFFI